MTAMTSVVSPPLIAVTGRVLPSKRITRWSNDAVASPRGYTDAVERAGGNAAVLPPVPLSHDHAAELLTRFDGLLLTGGADVNPELYGEKPHPETFGVDAVTDQFELALFEAAVAADLPVLGVCRGMQVINVARGGTLIQHITAREDLIAHGDPRVEGSGALHDVEIEPGTRLAKALGAPETQAMSHHHQALKRLGGGLTATARTSDQLIEAVELDDASWVVAVQWHPEETAQADPVQQHLFDAFVQQAAHRR